LQNGITRSRDFDAGDQIRSVLGIEGGADGGEHLIGVAVPNITIGSRLYR
jgi:hypothetical protein